MIKEKFDECSTSVRRRASDVPATCQRHIDDISCGEGKGKEGKGIDICEVENSYFDPQANAVAVMEQVFEDQVNAKCREMFEAFGEISPSERQKVHNCSRCGNPRYTHPGDINLCKECADYMEKFHGAE